MYDAREKALRDRKWEIDAAKEEGRIEGQRQGEIKGRIELLQTLQGLLGRPIGEEEVLRAMGLDQLQAMTRELQEKLRGRTPSSPEWRRGAPDTRHKCV